MESNIKIFVNSRQAVNPLDILFIKGESNYTTIFYSNNKRKEVYAQTLHIVASKFENYPNFCRISKSVIINMDCIETVNKNEVKLISGEKLKPSRRRAKDFLCRIHNLPKMAN